MSWKSKITDQWADKCRFALRAALFVNALLVSLTSIWITAKVCWFFVGLLARTVFSAPW
jgi:hypothetical protein